LALCLKIAGETSLQAESEKRASLVIASRC
jgi:hypothetical protein